MKNKTQKPLTPEQEVAKAIRDVLDEFGHKSVLDVQPLDALDMIAAEGDGWTAALASAVYVNTISKAARR